MRNILITGANSYIGQSLEQWLQQWPEDYRVDTVDMIDGTWRDKDFSPYDTIFHVAGIAHVDTKKASKETQDLYYKVNRDLTIDTAAKAKGDGVKQFIFMSSIIVYGDSSPIGEKRVITKDTKPNPSSFYGDSKLQAENGILPMQSEDFHVVIVRPPMIYGKGSRGNYPRLAKLAKSIPVFPDMENERSMLYVENLCECIRLLIEDYEQGLFFPQNKEYVKTSEMVRVIGQAYGRRVHLIRIFNPMIKLFGNRVALVNKVFGNQVYDKELSSYKAYMYCVSDLKKSIETTEA